ncbi:hypothetical protein [Salinarchaeum laminariae]|uniref:hypothetical protein n=1 Tax=Salinarchaeum laminariae TaxID=869888 RepID=UPI0020BDE977|nr:hypothetical protein [Salinarchaeum laminariae]
MDLSLPDTTDLPLPSLAPPASVFVLSPAFHAESETVCTDPLAVDDPANRRTLIIDITTTPHIVQRRCTDDDSEALQALGIIGVKYMDSASEETPERSSLNAADRTEFVQNPGDLAGISVARQLHPSGLGRATNRSSSASTP